MIGWIHALALAVVLIVARPASALHPLPRLDMPAAESTPDPNAAAEQAEAAANLAQQAAAQASSYASAAQASFGLGFNLVNLFGVLGGILALAATVGGILGIRRLEQLQREIVESRNNFDLEIKQAKQNFQDDLAGSKADLIHVRDQLTAHASNAILALSLLPLGERQYNAKDYRGALDTYERALELDADNPILNYRLGYIHTRRDELDESRAYLLRALELEPNFPPALAALGYVYRRMGEKIEAGGAREIERSELLNEAERYLLQALKASPQLVDEDGESWWGSLGGLYRRRGQTEQAIYAYQRAAQVIPYSSYPFSNLALLYMSENDRDDMLAQYRKVERLAFGEMQASADNYWAQADLLTSKLALGKTGEADAACETLLEIVPDDDLYALESLIDTLERLLVALGGPDQADHIPPYVDRLKAHVAARQKPG